MHRQRKFIKVQIFWLNVFLVSGSKQKFSYRVICFLECKQLQLSQRVLFLAITGRTNVEFWSTAE